MIKKQLLKFIEYIKTHKNSLRTVLLIWFLALSIIPTALVTIYSYQKYKESAFQQINERVLQNIDEITDKSFNQLLRFKNEAQEMLQTPALYVYVLNKDKDSLNSLFQDWQINYNLESIVFCDRSFEQIVGIGSELSCRKGEELDYKQQIEIDSGKVYSVQRHIVKSQSGPVAGELIIKKLFINPQEQDLASLINAEIFIINAQNMRIASSFKDQSGIKKIQQQIQKQETDLESLSLSMFLNSNEHQFRFKEFIYKPYVLAYGQNIESFKKILSEIQIAFTSALILIVLILIFVATFLSKYLLNPIYSLLEAIKSMDKLGDSESPIDKKYDNELGELIDSYNSMNKTVINAQKQLQAKVNELQLANETIKQTQDQLVQSAKMASLGQLVAGVAHELNNPIGFIYANMQHLKDYINDLERLIEAEAKGRDEFEKVKKEIDYDYIMEDLPKLITSCEEGARRTKDIVLGLKVFSRSDESKLQDYDIVQGLENTIKLLQGEIKDRIELVKNFEAHPIVDAYGHQLDQVFMNLISNSAQAIPKKGKITLTVRDHQDKVLVKIKDTGAGISKENLNKIFDPFYTTKAVGQGTGLGLSITYGIIEKHGGHVEVQSEPGEGTEFTLSIPKKQNS